MDSISVSEFKALCLRLLREVKATGKPLTIYKGKEPLAVVIPPPTARNRKKGFGAMKTRTVVKGDLIAPLDGVKWDALT